MTLDLTNAQKLDKALEKIGFKLLPHERKELQAIASDISDEVSLYEKLDLIRRDDSMLSQTDCSLFIYGICPRLLKIDVRHRFQGEISGDRLPIKIKKIA